MVNHKEIDDQIIYFITNGYLGKRLFRWNQMTGKVLQIVVKLEDIKKGRPNLLGIYYVAESTLRGNYLWHLKNGKDQFIKPTTEKLFNFYFDLMTKKLKDDIKE